MPKPKPSKPFTCPHCGASIESKLIASYLAGQRKRFRRLTPEEARAMQAKGVETKRAKWAELKRLG
jgi:hypothetical protein